MFCPRNFQIGCHWTLYCDYLSHCSEKWFPKLNFQSLYQGFGFALPHLLGLFVSRRSCFESRRICFVFRMRCFESRTICFAPFLGLFASRRSCFAPRWKLNNAIWAVLVLCTKLTCDQASLLFLSGRKRNAWYNFAPRQKQKGRLIAG